MRQSATKTLRFFAATLAAIAFLFAFAAGTTDVKAADIVTDVKQTGVTKNSVTVEFTEIGADYYGGVIYSDAACTKALNKTRSASTTLTFSGLNVGSTYWVKVGNGTDANNCYGNASDPCEVITKPEDMGVVSFVGASDTAATISWAPVQGATDYAIEYPGVEKLISTKGATSFQLPLTNYTYAFVHPIRVNSKGGYAVGNYSRVANLSLLTTKVDKDFFGITNVLSSGTCYVRVGNGVCGNGFEVEGKAVKGKGSFSVKTANIGASAIVNAKNKVMYKYRVRAYVTLSNGQVQYGQWSDYKYLGSSNVKCSAPGDRKIKVTWGKCKGVGRFVVKMSTSPDGKFTKVATAKGNAKSVVIGKYKKKPLEYYKTYYIRVYYQVKKGKKYVDSDVYSEYSGQITRSYRYR
ncbi:MAG: hypothetical protein K5739_10500 [Lachnospiraceae bacterium]|nr:hypothetical protein [Lachnospiraceae bacterium]